MWDKIVVLIKLIVNFHLTREKNWDSLKIYMEKFLFKLSQKC